MPQTKKLPVMPTGYTRIDTVTPSDTVNFTGAKTQGLLVGGTGDVTVQMPGAASPFTFSAVPAGAFLPISPLRVMSTGTTATNIVRMG